MEFVVLRCVLEHLRHEYVQLVDNLRDGFRARNLYCGGGIRLSLTLQILAVGRAQWGRDITVGVSGILRCGASVTGFCADRTGLTERSEGRFLNEALNLIAQFH